MLAILEVDCLPRRPTSQKFRRRKRPLFIFMFDPLNFLAALMEPPLQSTYFHFVLASWVCGLLSRLGLSPRPQGVASWFMDSNTLFNLLNQLINPFSEAIYCSTTHRAQMRNLARTHNFTRESRQSPTNCFFSPENTYVKRLFFWLLLILRGVSRVCFCLLSI